MIKAMQMEIDKRNEIPHQSVLNTIYFGGGTPSLLTSEQTELLLDTLRLKYIIAGDTEITLEVNPEHVSKTRALEWKQMGINRISLGVQSLDNDTLRKMNRMHDASQAIDAIETLFAVGFENVSVDIIFGMTRKDKYFSSLKYLLSLPIKHFSAYQLTIEPQTYFGYLQKKNKLKNIADDADLVDMFYLTRELALKNGFEHYEISNYARGQNFRSRHNLSYWQRETYTGIGPSAHSYFNGHRRWNIANNPLYIRKINEGQQYFSIEELSNNQVKNEVILTSLRLKDGINLQFFDEADKQKILKNSENYLKDEYLKLEQNFLKLTEKGLIWTDRITQDLFFI